MMALSWLVKILLFATAVVGILGSELQNSNATAEEENPHTTSWTVNFIRETGYEVETHEVTTEDGYILTLHRIPSHNGRGKPVLLHHGFLGRSADFVVLGHKNSLGFILANKGYDVWMANARGSTDSKIHETIKSTDRAFWDFSWHEIGYYDIPAEIDYILEQTGNKDLSFIGFSMGTSAYFVTMSTRPEYNSKVDKMIALGPVSFMEHVKGPVLKYIAPLTARIPWVLSIFGNGEFLPTNSFMTWAAKKFCSDDKDTQKLCQNVLFLFYGYDSPKMNGDLVERIFEYSPSGGSTKQFLHFAQLVRSAPTFRMYDYGFFKNIFKYHQTSPPEYELKQVTTPVHLFMAGNDWFADKNDVTRLSMKLPNVKTVTLVNRDNFNHFDFVYASDAKELCYRDVVRILEN